VWQSDAYWFDVAVSFTPFPIALLIGVSVVACGRGADDREADPDPAGAARARIGVVFDPSRVRAGVSIAGLVVERVTASRAVADSSFVGEIAFRGEVELSGRTLPHFEADASDAACFEADSASAARLPRWAGDRRRSWFCFSNTSEATRALGPSRAERPARIVIADFVIHRGLSDQVNSARFVRIVGDSAFTASPDRALETAAKEIVAFLQGKRQFDGIRLADTVPWTRMTTRPGRHFNCHEYPLGSRFPHLATLPHVGVKLEPDRPASCLESWNATFVFDTSAGRPQLIAAVYDQWEW
jgi:hypothetical protein